MWQIIGENRPFATNICKASSTDEDTLLFWILDTAWYGNVHIHIVKINFFY